MRRARAVGICLVWCLAAGSASGFAVDGAITQLCTTCPSGERLDVEASLRGTMRWDANPSVGALRDGLQVTIVPGAAATIGVSDPVLAAKIDAAIAAGVEAWSSPSVAFDITLGEPDAGTEISIATGSTAYLGGFTSWSTVYSFGRTFTNGDIVPGTVLTHADVTLNVDTLNQLFHSLGESYSLAALQRLVSHEIGHALGLTHPSFRPDLGIDSDDDPSNALVVDYEHPFAGLRQSSEYDDSAVMVPWSDLPGLAFAFETPLHNDDLAGRDVLYPHLVPEPAGVALLGLAFFALCELIHRRGPESGRMLRARGESVGVPVPRSEDLS